MEKTMVVSGKSVASRSQKGSGMEMVRGRKRSHIAIWLEIFRDVSSQWKEAEHGRSSH